MDTSQIISVAIFVVAMIAIMTEKVHRALVAITGAMLLLILHIMPFETAIGHIDFNTLGVLFGMMLFVAVVKQSGVFEFLAIKCARVAKGNPWTIMVLFVLLTAVLSAFLDNVTTVLLIGPMTITVCRLLDIDPVPFFMTQILASNIGGTATLIGDPPNIMIGSAAGYTFADFIAYDAPAVIIILAAVIGLFYVMYGRKISANEEHRKAIMELDENDYIKDRRLLHISVAMVVLVVVGFMTHGALGLESCVIALAAAGLILLISGESIEEALHGVEWTTLCFFAGLFIIVGAMSETGVIGMLAQGLIDVTGGNLALMLPVVAAGLVLSVAAIKPLNLLLLGENYARTMGLNVQRTRTLIFLSTVLLAGTVTAFCGPVGFIGLAVPHLARMLFASADHRILMPGSMLAGAALLLVCDLVAKSLALPINTITALMGIPVVIFVVVRNRNIF